MATKTYRVSVTIPGRAEALTTAPFAFYSDADRWARDYARGKAWARARVVNSEGSVSSCYQADGNGFVVHVSSEVGTKFKEGE